MSLRARRDLIRAQDLTLGNLLERLAEAFGDKRIVEEAGGPIYTYRQAADRVARLAGGIAPKIERGDRVVLSLPNGYEMLLAAMAVTRAGGVAVPVNDKMRDDEINHVIEDSGASLVIRDTKEFEGPPIPAVPVDGKDVAVLFYTSGTTGKPKGAQLTHRALAGGMGRAAATPPIMREALTGMPVAHIAGFSSLVQMASRGTPVYLLPRFRPTDAMDAIESRKIAMFIGVPAMYRMMDEAGAADRDLSSVKVWSSGADVMPSELAKKFQRYGSLIKVPFTGKPLGNSTFVDGYGMVELGGGVATRVYLPGPETKKGSQGLVRAMRGNTLKVIDDAGNEVPHGEVGELAVKGRTVMSGYHGRADATSEAMTADGFIRTGDLAIMRKAGFFEFAGRKKDVIKHGGYSVFAVEVEAALAEHAAVAEAAVLGLPDERKGEIPVAAVRLHEGATATPDELIAFAKDRLSEYKVPQQVRIVTELPRTGTDKVQKAGLRPLFAE